MTVPTVVSGGAGGGGNMPAPPNGDVGSPYLIRLGYTGELALSPIGLSAFSRYSPKKYTGQMFGLWFTASAIGGVLAGLLGGEATNEGLESMSPIFSFMITYYLVIGVFLLALAFFIKPAKDLKDASDEKMTSSN